MHINNECLELLKRSEGLRLKSYLCPAGVWTIGYGHTGDDVRPNMTINSSKAEELLRGDLRAFEDGVERLVDSNTNLNEFSAMVSLAYNIGLGNFSKSDVLKYHNNGRKYDACMSFHDWRRGGGEILKGLVVRRLKEAMLYIS